MTKDALRSLQTGLAGLGYAPGPIDGLDGPKTKSAARAYADSAPVAAAASAPMIYQGAARYPVREIILHCSATRPDWMGGQGIAEKKAEIKRWHTSPPNSWSDIGYHWLVDRDGSVISGRAESVIGAHVVDRNKGTLGICLIGGHGSAETDLFEDNYTAAQDAAVRRLIAQIQARTQITTISGHNQYAPKACPGFNAPQWFKGA